MHLGLHSIYLYEVTNVARLLNSYIKPHIHLVLTQSSN